MLFCVILRQDPRRGCSRTSQYAPPLDGGFSLSDAKIAPSDIPKPFCVIPCPRPLTYGKYVTEIRDAQKGRKVRPSLRLVVGLNRAADCVTTRASNECVGGRPRADFVVSASVGIAAGGLTLIFACGSQAVRSPALVHSMHHNAERCRLSFHMPHILWASPRWRHTKKDTRRCLSPLWWEDMMNSQLIVQTQ